MFACIKQICPIITAVAIALGSMRVLICLVAVSVPITGTFAADAVVCTGCVGTNDITNLAITNSKLRTGAVTNIKLGTGAVTNTKLATSSVSSAKIQNGAVTLTKLGSDVLAELGGGIVLTTVVSEESDYGSNYFTSEVLSATCPTGSIITGGGAYCSSSNVNNDTTNFGVLMGSSPAGNSYLGLCVAEAITFSSYLYGPAITVYAVCAYSVNAATSQATNADVTTPQATSVDPISKSQQGEPSEEALLLLESLRNKAAEMASRISVR